jgi:diguanylate cyclase (GGDEF)-like protein/PAS domain S-box-containing protein
MMQQLMQESPKISTPQEGGQSRQPRLIVAYVVFLLAILASGMVVRLSEQRALGEQRANVVAQAEVHAYTIQRFTDRALSATYALAALVRQGHGRIANFESTAAQMLPYYPGVAALQLAPDGIVRHIVPLSGNEKAIGHNLLLDPKRDKEALLARDTGQLTLAGPFELMQGGGLAAIGRLPVFLDDHTGRSSFWGFTTVLIRFPKALEEAKLNQLAAQGLGYELSRIHPDSGQKQVIASSSSTPLVDPITRAIAIPNGSWTISVAPVNGWGHPLGLVIKAAAALTLSLLLAYMANLLVRLRGHSRRLEVLVAQRTTEISAVRIRLQATFDAIPDMLWLTNAQGTYLDCNPMFERFYGAPKFDIIGKSSLRTTAQQPEHDFRQFELAVIACARPSANEQWLTFADDGHRALFEVTRTPMRDPSGKVVGVLSIAHDVTGRKEAEAKIKRLSQLYAALSQCNQAIVRCTSDTQLFTQICTDVVRFGGMKMAWIGLTDANSQQLRPTASAGVGQEYLNGLQISTNPNDPLGHGPESRAIREKQAVWNQDFMNDPLTQPWHARAARFAWGSVAALPLQCNNKVIGSFNLYSQDSQAFDEQDVRNLLLEMVTDIDYALASFERESQRQEAEKSLRLAANVFTHAREAIMITDVEGTIVEVNTAFSRITGYTRGEVVGGNPRILKSGHHNKDHYAAMWLELINKGQWVGEIWNRRKNGEVYAAMQTISTVRDGDGKIQQYVAQFSDITAIKEHEQMLQRITNFDALTGLPNRVLLADRLQQNMTRVQRRGQRLAVVYIDLDGFQDFNNQHNHETGDRLLIALAANMQAALRKGDSLARLGSDEFVVVLDDLTDIETCTPILDWLLKAIAAPIQVGDCELHVSASLGITFYPQTEDVNPDQLLRQADQAMYHAKLAGKNRYHLFDADQDRNLRGHHESQERIRLALDKGEFVLYYQPKVNMRQGTLVGVEALIRWQHPQRGLLQPGEFLPVIENHPLACELGEWVMAAALAQIVEWQARGLNVPVSVNVGALQLQQENFVPRLRALLATQPEVRPGSLELEVLETSALEDLVHITKVIEECRGIGVFFALDDFGTGYSSLSYLRRLAVIQLKIDQSFVRDMIGVSEDLAILEAVIGLADAFKLQVIAEGVETIAQGTLLLKLGCEMAQGYVIARPMPADALMAWAAQWRPDAAWRDVPAAI